MYPPKYFILRRYTLTYLVHPVILFIVPHTPIQGIRGQDQDEVLGQLYTTEEILVKLSRLQFLNIQED